MSLSPEQIATAREILTNVESFAGPEMADFSLGDLEDRLKSELNESAVENMSEADFNKLVGLFGKHKAMLENDKLIEAYTLDQFKAEFAFFGQFFKGPLKAEIETLVNGVTAADFAEAKQNLLAGAARRRAAKAEAGKDAIAIAAAEGFNLNFRQAKMLRNVPEIGLLVERVRASGLDLNSDEAKEKLANLITDKVMEEVNTLFQKNLDIYATQQRAQQQEGFNEKVHAELGMRVEGVVGPANIKEHGGNALRFMVGQQGFQDIGTNPLLVAVLDNKALSELNDMWIAEAKSGGHTGRSPANMRNLIKTNVLTILDGKSVADVAKHFRKLHVVDGAATPEEVARDKAIMVKKLKTVPEQWRDTEEAQRYEDYVLETGPDAFDFEKALDRGFLGEVGFFRKLVMMIRGWLAMAKGMFGAEEDAEEWELIQKYKDGASEEGGDGADTGTGDDPPDNSPEAVKRGNKIFEALKAKVGPEFNLARSNGEAFSVKDGKDAALIEAIAQEYEAFPDAYPLLRKGLYVEDVLILGQSRGDQNGGEGFNVEFSNSGFTMSYDLQNYFGDAVGEVMGYTAGAGIAAGVAKSFAAVIGIKAIIAGAIGATIAYVTNLDELDAYGDRMHFDYNNLSPQRLHAAIAEMKADVGLIKEAFDSVDMEGVKKFSTVVAAHEDKFDTENIRKFPPVLFSQDGMSPALESLLADTDANFWKKADGTDYKITQEDLDNFAGELDTGYLDLGGDVDDQAEVFKGRGDDGDYAVEGSGWGIVAGYGRKGVKNAEEFFTWLKEQNA